MATQTVKGANMTFRLKNCKEHNVVLGNCAQNVTTLIFFMLHKVYNVSFFTHIHTKVILSYKVESFFV